MIFNILKEPIMGKNFKKNTYIGIALAVQGLRLSAPNLGCTGLIPSQGTKIPHAAQPKERKKKKKRIHIYTHIIYITHIYV